MSATTTVISFSWSRDEAILLFFEGDSDMVLADTGLLYIYWSSSDVKPHAPPTNHTLAISASRRCGAAPDGRFPLFLPTFISPLLSVILANFQYEQSYFWEKIYRHIYICLLAGCDQACLTSPIALFLSLSCLLCYRDVVTAWTT